MSDFDKVRAILDAATPGPWETHTYGHRSVRQASGAVTKALFAVPVSADVRSLMTDLTWVQTDDYNIALTGNGPHQTENARAIVVARNLAPALLAVAEAAEEWWNAYDETQFAAEALVSCVHSNGEDDPACTDVLRIQAASDRYATARRAVRAALDALYAKMKETLT